MEQQELDLGRYWRALWDRKVLIGVVMAAGLAAALFFTRVVGTPAEAREAVYLGKATVQIDRAVTGANPAVTSGVTRPTPTGLENHIQLIMSTPVLQRAAAISLGTSFDAAVPASPALLVEVEILRSSAVPRQVARTDVIEISVEATDGITARTRAQAIAQAYGEFLVAEAVKQAKDQLAAVEQSLLAADASPVTAAMADQLAAISAELSSIVQTIEGSSAQLSGQVSPAAISESTLNTVRIQVGAAVQQVSSLSASIDSLIAEVERQNALAVPFQNVPAAIAPLPAELRQVAENITLIAQGLERLEVSDVARRAATDLQSTVLPLRETASSLSASASASALANATTLLASANLALRNVVTAATTAETEVTPAGFSTEPTITRIVQLQAQIGASRITAARLSATLTGAQPASPGIVFESTANESTALAGIMRAIATSLSDVRRTVVASAFSLEKLSTAETRLRTAATDLDTAAGNLRSAASGGLSAPLRQAAQDMTAVATANERTYNAVIRSPDTVLTEVEAQLVANQASAALTTLNATVATLTGVRSVLTDGDAYSASVAAESRVKAVVGVLSPLSDRINTVIASDFAAPLLTVRDGLSAAGTDAARLVAQFVVTDGQPAPSLADRELAATTALSVRTSVDQARATVQSFLPSVRQTESRTSIAALDGRLQSVSDLLRGIGLTLSPETVEANNGLLAGARALQPAASRTATELEAAGKKVEVVTAASTVSVTALSEAQEALGAARSSVQSFRGFAAAVSGTVPATGFQADLDGVGTRVISALDNLDGAMSSLDAVRSDPRIAASERVTAVGARLSAIGENLSSTGMTAATVSSSATALAATERIGDVRVRLTVAATELDRSVADLQAVDRRQLPDGGLEVALVAGRLGTWRSQINAISGRLPTLAATGQTNRDDLLASQAKLQETLLKPAPSGVQTTGSSFELQSAASQTKLLRQRDLQALLGGFIGLLFAVTVVVAMEHFDRRVRRPEDLAGIPAFAVLGVVASGQPKGNPHPPEVTDVPGSPFSETVHLATTNIEARLKEGMNSILVTSARPQEGKTMLAVNLARALSQRGNSVLLVDANLRRPDASEVLDLKGVPGLANALASDTPIEPQVRPFDRFQFLPAGYAKVPPVELFSRHEFGEFIERSRSRYNVVIVDGPPALGFSETPALGRQVSPVLFAVRSGKTPATAVAEAMTVMRSAGATVMGGVLTFARPKTVHHIGSADYVKKKSRRRTALLRFLRNPRPRPQKNTRKAA
jgi:capsular exopolysaccharide synthesis family protein